MNNIPVQVVPRNLFIGQVESLKMVVFLVAGILYIHHKGSTWFTFNKVAPIILWP